MSSGSAHDELRHGRFGDAPSCALMSSQPRASFDSPASAQARIDNWLSDRHMEGLKLSQQNPTAPARLTRLPTSVTAGERRTQGVLDDIRSARSEIRAAAVDGTSAIAVVRALGGAERATTLLNLACLDEDGDGNLSPGEMDRYKAIGAALVESAKNFHLNAGVVAALVFSVIYGLVSALASLASPCFARVLTAPRFDPNRPSRRRTPSGIFRPLRAGTTCGSSRS